jgi:hypothetical protein
LDDARRRKRQAQADADRGELENLSDVAFGAYARDWIAGYQGGTSHGFRKSTRQRYGRALGGSLRSRGIDEHVVDTALPGSVDPGGTIVVRDALAAAHLTRPVQTRRVAGFRIQKPRAVRGVRRARAYAVWDVDFRGEKRALPRGVPYCSGEPSGCQQ